MRILWSDVIADASVSVDKSSLNYPASNLQDDFMEVRYQSSDNFAVITVEFSEDKIINSFFYGYHNIYGMTVQLLDSVDSELQSATLYDIDGFSDYDGQVVRTESGEALLTESGEELLSEVYGDVCAEIADRGRCYFTSQSGVRKIRISIESQDSTVYIGKMSAGNYYELLQAVSASFAHGNIDNSISSISVQGQTTQQYVEPLRKRSYNLIDLAVEEKNSLDILYRQSGKGKPLWFDIFSGDNDYDPVLYGVIMSPLSHKKDGKRYNTKLEIQEAR